MRLRRVLAVLVRVVLAGFLRVMYGVDMVAMGHVGMVTGCFVVPGFMMLGSGAMMLGGVLVMFGGFFMVFRALFRHV